MSATALCSRVSVGIGQIAESDDPDTVLVAYGLGSCVAVALWLPTARWAALAHILLPNSGGAPFDPLEPARYADHGVRELAERAARRGRLSDLVVKLAGGAAVLGNSHNQRFKVGDRNAEAIYEELRRLGLTVAAADVGGTQGRTLELYVADGRTFVRTAAAAAREL